MQHIHFLILSTSVFAIGFLGIFVNRKNIITILMSIELMLLSANINFVGFSYLLMTFRSNFFFVYFVVAAAEAI